MNKGKVVVFLSVLFSLGFMFISYFSASSAQTQSFGSVIPFSSDGRSVAFFDQASGKVYFYDWDLNTCKRIVQLAELGKKAEEIYIEEGTDLKFKDPRPY